MSLQKVDQKYKHHAKRQKNIKNSKQAWVLFTTKINTNYVNNFTFYALTKVYLSHCVSLF